MNPLPLRLLVACLSLSLPFAAFAPVACAAPDPEPPHPWTSDPAKIGAELESQWVQLAPGKTVSVRGVFRFALEAAAVGWHPERVEAALARGRALQDLDPKSKTYGNLKWRSDQAAVFDLNAVEFCMMQAALLRLRYFDALSPTGKKQLDELLVTGLEGIRRHTVKVDYTNISIMQAWNLMAIGQGLGRDDVAAQGYKQFDTWVRFTARNGLTEYGAVTYYGTDLDSLGLIAKYAADPEARGEAGAMIRYLWTDAAANWYAPGDRLASANARSYDYLYGRGYFEAHTWPAGWLRARPELESAGWISGGVRPDCIAFYRECNYAPHPDWTAMIRADVPRVVTQRWGTEPWTRAVAYIGHHVSLASSGGTRGSDERTLVANLGDSPSIPELTFFMDGRGDPFGTKKVANAAAEAKALHLQPLIATVQRGSEVLQILSDVPRGPKTKYKSGELSCFLSQFTLPASATVWIGDHATEPGSPENPVLVPAGAPVVVRLGDAALGIRFLLTRGVSGAAAPVQFVSDSPKSPARRLTVVHSATEPAPNARGTVAVYVSAAEGLADDAAFAAWRQAFANAPATAKFLGETLVAELRSEKAPLRAELDLSRGERRLLSGGEPDALLGINGHDFGRELLAAYLK